MVTWSWSFRPKTESQRRWQRRVLLFYLVLFVIWLFFRIHQYVRLRVELGRLHAAGYPVTLAQLNAWYPTPKGENAADVYAKSFAAIQHDRELEKTLPPFNGLVLYPALGDAPPPDMIERSKALLALNREALDIARGVNPELQCRFPTDFSTQWQVLLPHLGSLVHLQRLFILDAMLQSEDNNAAAVTKSIQAIMTASDSLRTEPTELSQIVRLSMAQQAIGGLQRSIARVDLVDENLAALTTSIRRLKNESAYDLGIAGDRVQNLAMINQEYPESIGDLPKFGVFLFRLSGWSDYERVAYLDVMAGKDRRFSMASLFVWPGGSSRKLHRALNMSIDLAQAALAAKRFELHQHRLPHSLQELVPEYLDAVPTDIFDKDGSPIRYRLTDSGAILYSVRWDGLDDNGVEKVGGEGRGDLSFEIRSAVR